MNTCLFGRPAGQAGLSARLGRIYDRRLGLHDAAADILHIAITVAYELDYLVTRNCAHIANGQVIHRLMVVNEEIGKATPVITTPEFLLEITEGEPSC